jgi:hypothetical protein
MKGIRKPYDLIIILINILALVFFPTYFAMAQNTGNLNDSESLLITKISGGIIFDGIPDEAAWQSIEALPMVMYTPVSGGAPTEKSVVKIAYDDEYFYVSAQLYYQNISDMRAVGKKRDYLTFSSDWFGLIMDTFNDKENALLFGVNPNGARNDGTIQNDLLVTSDANFSYNTFWDAATVINENGWTTEIRIPFSSLRFQTDQGKTRMGIIIMRSNAANRETVTWPVVSPNFVFPFWKPSLCTLIEFEGLEPKKPVYISPYVTAGIGQINKLNEPETGYEMTSTFKRDVGLDVKYSLTNNLTADITINTDFAQVEADNQVINLTRYSLYFPEKRNFFLEKADVFDFSLLENNNLFYSRRIGLHRGNPVRIYGGVRLTGRVGQWDVGILNMQTEKFEENPSENFGVVRVKRKVINPYSYLGGIVTSRLGTDGSYNVAYGLDGLFRVTGDDYLTIKWAQTFENVALNKVFDASPSRSVIRWQRRKETGFAYDFIYGWSGENFNPGIGFELKQDYQGPQVTLQYGWLPGKESILRHHKISLESHKWWSTVSGNHETTNAVLKWDFDTKKGSSWYFAAHWSLENLPGDLILGNYQAMVPTGEYSFTDFSAWYRTSSTRAFSSSFYTNAGNFYDGWKWSFYTIPNLIIGTDFEIGFYYRFDMVKFPERSMEFTNHIARLNGLMTLTTKTSLTAFLQYNTAIDRVIGNLRFRYNPRDGNDFYIVFDETMNSDLTRATPYLPRTAGRTILLKYTYTFKL